jgi:hypothetical protein
VKAGTTHRGFWPNFDDELDFAYTTAIVCGISFALAQMFIVPPQFSLLLRRTCSHSITFFFGVVHRHEYLHHPRERVIVVQDALPI